jgi:drug/metabolite transporter (DMT)-like permease
MHQTSGRWRLGLALSLLTVFLWGILPIALRVTLQALDAYTLTWFRFLASFALLTMYLGVRRELPSLDKLRAASWQLLAIATVFLAINYILYLLGLALTTAANAQVLIQLAPVLLGFGGLVLFKERYSLSQWVGVGVLTFGFVLFFNSQLRNLVTTQGQYLIGSALIVLAALAWAVYALAQKQLLQQLCSANIMLLIYGGSAILFAPFAKPQVIFTLSPWHWGVLLFCALNTLVAYGSFAEALEHWEASRVSAILAVTPIVTITSQGVSTILMPSLIAPENLGILGILGAILVVAGSMFVALGHKK